MSLRIEQLPQKLNQFQQLESYFSKASNFLSSARNAIADTPLQLIPLAAQTLVINPIRSTYNTTRDFLEVMNSAQTTTQGWQQIMDGKLWQGTVNVVTGGGRVLKSPGDGAAAFISMIAGWLPTAITYKALRSLLGNKLYKSWEKKLQNNDNIKKALRQIQFMEKQKSRKLRRKHQQQLKQITADLANNIVQKQEYDLLVERQQLDIQNLADQFIRERQKTILEITKGEDFYENLDSFVYKGLDELQGKATEAIDFSKKAAKLAVLGPTKLGMVSEIGNRIMNKIQRRNERIKAQQQKVK